MENLAHVFIVPQFWVNAFVRSKKIKEEKKEELKRFNVVRHTMCIPTSTATLGVVCIQV